MTDELNRHEEKEGRIWAEIHRRIEMLSEEMDGKLSEELTVSYRGQATPDETNDHTGFRCARSVR